MNVLDSEIIFAERMAQSGQAEDPQKETDEEEGVLQVNNLGIVRIGRRGENESQTVHIDCNVWLQQMPGANLILLAVRPTEKDVYIPNIDVNSGVISWTVQAQDTALAGYGWGEIRAISGTKVKKSKTFVIRVETSLEDASGYVPTSPPDWLNEVFDAATQAIAAKDATEAAARAAQAAMDQAAAATVAANEAAEAANEAAGAADTAAEDAKTAANNANTKAASAAAAAGKIENMTADAESLSSGSAPSATVTEVGGHKHLHLGIPRGVDGRDGIIASVDAGLFSMQINDDGDLICTYSTEPPALSINSSGDLIYTI